MKRKKNKMEDGKYKFNNFLYNGDLDVRIIVHAFIIERRGAEITLHA